METLDLARGLMLNNPGNIKMSRIKYAGEVDSKDSVYKEFESMAYGFRAMFVILYTYKVRYSITILKYIIRRYAPKEDGNDIEKYLNFIEKKTGYTPDMELNAMDESEMIPLVTSMAWMETGIKPNPKDVKQGFDWFRNDLEADAI